MGSNSQVKVWDPLVRIFHWALVTAFTIAYFTDDEELLLPHVWAGYAVIGLLLFRLLWGFVGTRHARFSDFIHAPSAALAFVRDTLKGKAKRYLGHNPAGRRIEHTGRVRSPFECQESRPHATQTS